MVIRNIQIIPIAPCIMFDLSIKITFLTRTQTLMQSDDDPEHSPGVPNCLVHLGVRDKRQVSEIDLSKPRHETAFWWRHNGPVTSQLN